jgi:mannose-6-phosphate isomerase-like protein (cupin superfamily)
MVIYPAGSGASDYHHEGADSFVYILSGRGAAWANGQKMSLQPGDLVYFHARERHHLKAADNADMRFLLFYVPGEFKTVWADAGKVNAWVKTDRDINGRKAGERRHFTSALSIPVGPSGPFG